MATQEYVPGVCNIGPAEIARRRRAGYIGLISSVVFFAILLVFDISPVYRLLIFIPVMSAASGFLQAHFRFCAGFGLKGVYNVLKPVGQTETVTQNVFRKRDRQKALQITGMAILIGLIVAGIVYYLPF